MQMCIKLIVILIAFRVIFARPEMDLVISGGASGQNINNYQIKGLDSLKLNESDKQSTASPSNHGQNQIPNIQVNGTLSFTNSYLLNAATIHYHQYPTSPPAPSSATSSPGNLQLHRNHVMSDELSDMAVQTKHSYGKQSPEKKETRFHGGLP
jgi:hypothetical protein